MDGANILENHERRIGKLEVEVGKTKVIVREIKSRQDDMEKDFKEMKEIIIDIRQDIATMKATLKWTLAFISSVSGFIGGVIGWILHSLLGG